ncbi:hypothetical protein F4818DRAFT_387332 [Hypoxylon cercidicola]|nr:hypothetical protein F4818DRAFT_387332 [Hypoxylon cercidicola]
MGEENPPLDGNTFILPKSTPRLPVPVEKLSTPPMNAKYVTTTLWELLKPSMFSKNPAQAGWAPIQASPYKTQVRFFAVDREALDNILAKRRQHQTTITGLLHALAALSFASHLRDASGFQGGTPIDARRFLQAGPGFEPDRTMANYVTMMDHEFASKVVEDLWSASPDAETLKGVWSIAADVRRQINKKSWLAD